MKVIFITWYIKPDIMVSSLPTIFFFALRRRQSTDSLPFCYQASSIDRFFLLPVLISPRDLVVAALSCSSRGGHPQPYRSFASIFIFATPTGPPRDDQLLPLRGADLLLATTCH
jgi:hypothetical protein